jgi:hypothetical protein
MGARTVAGEMTTFPIVKEEGTVRVARVRPPVNVDAAASPELSQNFFTALFYLHKQKLSPEREL